MTASLPPLASTERSTVTRHRERAATRRAELYAVLDVGLVCHVGFVRDGAPVVLPTGYGRDGDTVYLHGSTGSGAWPLLDAAPVCLTVTHVDAIVYARSAFHHSMNYRSAVVHGRARVVTDAAERLAGLAAIVDQLAPGSWDYARRPTRKEIAATTVVALDLAEASVKVRHGPPGDDASDVVDRPDVWAGLLPVHEVFGEPRSDATVPTGVAAPDHVSGRIGRRVSP